MSTPSGYTPVGEGTGGQFNYADYDDSRRNFGCGRSDTGLWSHPDRVMKGASARGSITGIPWTQETP